jgi:hypothetical protein
MSETTSHLNAVIRLGGIDANFDHMVDAVIKYLRGRMGVSAPAEPGDADDVIEAEFAAVRTRLSSLRSQYHELYANILAEHLEAERLPAMVAALQNTEIQTYLATLKRVEPQVASEMAKFGDRMREAAFAAPC